jgi:modulator of FtsH protease
VHPGIADWTNLFAAEVAAAAALTGLVAVAISINLARILSFPQPPARATLARFPGQPEATFDAEALAIGVIELAVSIVAQARGLSARGSPSSARKIARAAVSAAAIGPLIVGAATVVAGSAAGLYVLAIGALISPAAGAWNSWILLVEILR